MTLKFISSSFNNLKNSKRKPLFEGNTKSIYEGQEAGTFLLYFKDNHPFLKNNPLLSGKGVINNRLSSLLFERLEMIGIDTHFIKFTNMREQQIRIVEPLPFYIDVINMACDDFSRRYGIDYGTTFSDSIFEFHIKNPESGNPLAASEHLLSFGYIDSEEIEYLMTTTARINDFLRGQFSALQMQLMQFSIQFGRIYLSENPQDSRLILIDEISLDTCRVIDIITEKRLDVFGTQFPSFEGVSGYQEVAKRFGILS